MKNSCITYWDQNMKKRKIRCLTASEGEGGCDKGDQQSDLRLRLVSISGTTAKAYNRYKMTFKSSPD